MDRNVRLFIGSSSTPQSLQVVETITDLLQGPEAPAVEVVPWREGIRPSSKTVIETLEDIATRSDFALMVLGDDDDIRVVRERGGTYAGSEDTTQDTFRKAPRDNVIFELGMFIGLIGRERCMVVYDKSIGLKLPSDIDGVVPVPYEPTPPDGLRAALKSAVDNIARTLRRQDIPKRPGLSEVDAWDASRRFSNSITGYWWSRRDWDSDSVGFVRLSTDLVSSMPKVLGRAFRCDGTPVAKWSSDAACVVPAERKLYFRFTGDHPPSRPRKGKETSEEYRGFSEYTFDPPNSPLEATRRGHGELWDLNLSRRSIRTRLTLDLERCELEAVECDALTDGVDRSLVERIVQRVLPPLQPRPTFWTCAAGCEGVFVDLAIRIHQDQTRCLALPDRQRQQVCLAEIEQRTFEAKRALYTCLSRCVNTYGAPPFMTVPDPSAPNGVRVVPFSLGAYHSMLVARHLEKPE